MAINHSTLNEPVAIVSAVTGVSANTAVVVTAPSWAASVDIGCAGHAIKVGTSGTEGSALTNYRTIPSGVAYNLPLKAYEQGNFTNTFLVETSDTAHVVEYTYLPRTA